MYVCMYIYIYICIHTHISVDLCMCVCIYIYIYTYTYIICFIFWRVASPRTKHPDFRGFDPSTFLLSLIQLSSGSLAPDGGLACARMCWGWHVQGCAGRRIGMFLLSKGWNSQVHVEPPRNSDSEKT